MSACSTPSTCRSSSATWDSTSGTARTAVIWSCSTVRWSSSWVLVSCRSASAGGGDERRCGGWLFHAASALAIRSSCWLTRVSVVCACSAPVRGVDRAVDGAGAAVLLGVQRHAAGPHAPAEQDERGGHHGHRPPPVARRPWPSGQQLADGGAWRTSGHGDGLTRLVGRRVDAAGVGHHRAMDGPGWSAGPCPRVVGRGRSGRARSAVARGSLPRTQLRAAARWAAEQYRRAGRPGVCTIGLSQPGREQLWGSSPGSFALLRLYSCRFGESPEQRTPWAGIERATRSTERRRRQTMQLDQPIPPDRGRLHAEGRISRARNVSTGETGLRYESARVAVNGARLRQVGESEDSQRSQPQQRRLTFVGADVRLTLHRKPVRSVLRLVATRCSARRATGGVRLRESTVVGVVNRGQ